MVELQFGTTRREGRQIAYKVVGEGQLRTVWIAGTNVDSRFWEIAQAFEFARTGSCLLIDGAGTGGTDGLPDGQWSAESMARDVLTAMDAVLWTDAHIIGHSLGAAIAAEVACISPKRARSISLHAGWRSAADNEHVRAWFEARRETAMTEDPVLIAAYTFFLVSPRYLQRVGRSEGALKDLETRVGSPTLETKLGHYQADLSYSGADRLEKLRVPALVTSAEHDQAIPPFASEELAASIPGAKLHTFAGVGHLAPLEDPEQFNRVQLDFISRVEREQCHPAGHERAPSISGESN